MGLSSPCAILIFWPGTLNWLQVLRRSDQLSLKATKKDQNKRGKQQSNKKQRKHKKGATSAKKSRRKERKTASPIKKRLQKRTRKNRKVAKAAAKAKDCVC